MVQTYVMAPAQTRLGAATATFRLNVFGTTGYAYAKPPGYSDQLGLGLKGCVTPRTAEVLRDAAWITRISATSRRFSAVRRRSGLATSAE